METIRTFCAWCSKKEKVNGQWEPCPREIAKLWQYNASHGICPDCRDRLANGWHPIQQ